MCSVWVRCERCSVLVRRERVSVLVRRESIVRGMWLYVKNVM